MFEDRMAKLLYKLTVEMDMGMTAALDCIQINDDFDPGVGAGKLPALRVVVVGRASLVTPGLYPAIIPTRAKPARISTTYAPAV